MEIIISCRNNDMKPAIRTHAEERAAKLKEIYNKLTTCRVILNVERKEETAEFILHGKNIDIEAKVSSKDVYEAIDKVADKVEKQLRKRIDKIQDYH